MKNKQAGKAFNRLMGNWYADTEEAEACDACFDAGEWSGPAWGRTHEAKEDAMSELVAQRFGITTDEVIYVAQELEFAEVYEQSYKATTPWEPWTDDKGIRHHGVMCHEYKDRGLSCACMETAK